MSGANPGDEVKMRQRAIGSALVTIIFWSSAFAGIRVGLTAFSVWHLVLLRFGTASLVLLGGVLMTRGRLLPPRSTWPRVALSGLSGFTIYQISLTLGERTVAASTASFIIAAAPLFSTILARVFLQEELSGWAWVGMLLAFLGVGIISGFGQGFHGDALLIVLSAVSTAVFFVVEKPLLARYRVLDVTAWVTWAGTLPMLAFAGGMVRAVEHAPSFPLLMVIYIGVFPAAAAYVTWSLALRDAGMAEITPILYLNPVLASLLGWIMLGERPGWSLVAGGIFIMGGVWMIQTRGKRPTSWRTQEDVG